MTANDSLALLHNIMKNAEMGVNTITELVKLAKDTGFRQALQSQLNEYQQIFKEANELIFENDQDPKGLNAYQKASTYMMLKMNTLTDSSSSHIAEMIMQGNAMGIISITKWLRLLEDHNEKAVALGQKLLETEQHNFESMKQFL